MTETHLNERSPDLNGRPEKTRSSRIFRLRQPQAIILAALIGAVPVNLLFLSQDSREPGAGTVGGELAPEEARYRMSTGEAVANLPRSVSAFMGARRRLVGHFEMAAGDWRAYDEAQKTLFNGRAYDLTVELDKAFERMRTDLTVVANRIGAPDGEIRRLVDGFLAWNREEEARRFEGGLPVSEWADKADYRERLDAIIAAVDARFERATIETASQS